MTLAPALSAIVELLEKGRASDAVRAFGRLKPELAAGAPDAIRIGVGVGCGALGRLSCAQEQLGAVMGGGGALADLAAWRLGQALHRPRPTQAMAAYGSVTAGTPLAGQARIELARLRLAAEDAHGALAALREADSALLNNTGRARRLGLRAQALAMAGLTHQATEARRDLVDRFPGSADASREAENLTWHERWLHLADSGITRRNGKRIKAEILAEVRRLRDGRAPARRRWYPWYALGVAELKRGRPEFAEARFNDVLAEADDAELIARALVGRARSLRRRNHDLAAARDYVAAAQAFPHSPLAGHALYEATFLTHLRGRDDLALSHVQSLLDDAGPCPERAKGLWMKGWLLYRADRLDEAVVPWEQLLFESPDAFEWSHGGIGDRVAYWTARAHHKAGRATPAEGLWEELIRRRPLAYYSHLAFDRLSGADPERAAKLRQREGLGGWPKAPLAFTEHTLLDQPEVRPVAELIRHGMHKEAWRLLRWVYWREMLPQGSLNFVAAFARVADDLHASHRVLLRRGWFDQHPEDGAGERWRLAFPVAYADLVKRYAALRGIDPFLILAIMRHESGFDRRARSGANAAGLIQVILSTARMTARWMGERPPRRIDEMFEPDRNVRIGTRYLQHVLESVDGNAALAVAGYNAGAGAIRVWRDRWGHLDTDEFVEELPYREAHGYTKQVMQAWGTYRYLYGPRGADEARHLALPIRAKPTEQAEIGPIAAPSHSLTPPGGGPTFGRTLTTAAQAME